MSARSTDHPIVGLLGRSGTRADRVLPPDVAADVARRLGIAALSMAFVLAVAIPTMLYVEGSGLRPARPLGVVFAAAALVTCLGVFAAARWGRLVSSRLVQVGLAYEVLICFLVSLWDRFGPFPEGDLREVSFVCVIVVLFPVLVPATPRTTLAVSLASALTGPVAYGLARLYGYAPRPLGDLALSTTYSLVCAGLAVAPSLVITRLVTSVSAARELGSYQLEELLGRGGMGEVWRARHRLLAQPAAIKLILPHRLASSPEGAALAVERFRREARVTAALRSQHTVNLLDFGLADDGTFFYAMELLEGLDLSTLVERHGPLPPSRAVHLLRQACLSLAEAHEHGLVHRDVKPANLFVCKRGFEADHLKVLDFGLVSGSLEPTDPRLTTDEGPFGTPTCMAPEQAKGEDVTSQADVYALGCVVYFLLAGRHVFTGANAAVTVLAHVSAPPVPLRERVGDAVPEDLERVVLACLAKDPADRPAGVLELRRRLSACACAGAWTEAEATAWWAEHRTQTPWA
jgi:serine/threonine-protein kinase